MVALSTLTWVTGRIGISRIRSLFPIPIICDIELRRVSPMMNRLLAVALCAMDLMRPFSR